MDCPICRNDTELKVIESGLEGTECERHGIWIPALHYWKWIATQNITYPPEINDGEFEAGETDTKSGKVCSDCGKVLRRYAVGHGVGFHVDQCPNCTSIWLDSGEWEILKEKNLHSAIHFMFSEPWQNRVKKDKVQDHFESQYRTRLGDSLFEEVHAFKKMIIDHEDCSLILTYLRAKVE